MRQAPVKFSVPADFVGMDADIGHGPTEKKLVVPYLAQTVTNWCWATCATMLARFFLGTRLKICHAASTLIPAGNCCSGAPLEGSFNPTWDNATCNRTCSVAEVNQLHVKLGLSSRRENGPVGYAALQAELAANRPVEVAYAWTGGGGHVAIVYGYNGSTNSVNINDPWPDTGQVVVPFPKLVSAYGKGHWFDTWTGISAVRAG